MRGEGRIFKRGSRFWIAYCAPKNGRSLEHREPGGDTEGEARKVLKARLRERAVAEAGIREFQGPAQERVTVEELLKDLERDYEIHGRKSLPQLRSHLAHIRKHFAEARAVSVRPGRIQEYVVQRQREGAKPATINHEVKGLSRAFALAAEAGTIFMVPRVKGLSERNARQGFFEKSEFEAVLSNMPDEDLRDFCRWFYLTGMRPGEIRSLSWSGFDRETWTLRLHARDAKTGYGRTIVLKDEFRRVIERRLSVRRLDCPLVFHRDGRPIGDFRKLWWAACVGAELGSYVRDEKGRVRGYRGKILYDFRRTAVRNMIRAGVPERVAMEISGHRTRSVFDRYNITSEQDLQEAASKVSAYVGSLPTVRVASISALTPGGSKQ